MACFVSQDPSTLLLFTTLPAIGRAPRPKSLRPADRIRMLPKSGVRGGSSKHWWEPCRRPPGLVPAPFGNSWRRPGVLLRPGKGVEAKNEARTTREQGAGSTSERKTGIPPPGIGDWNRKNRLGGVVRPPKHLVLFIPKGGFRLGSCLRTPQLCCYLLHLRPSAVRGAPNPCALPTESASGPFRGFGEGQENLGGNRADGLPAWFRLPSASPGGGVGFCSCPERVIAPTNASRSTRCHDLKFDDWVRARPVD